MIRKSYASQESVETTLTASERVAPFCAGASDAHAFGASAPVFALSQPDAEPLPAVTRAPVVVDGETIATIDPHTGETIHVVILREVAA